MKKTITISAEITFQIDEEDMKNVESEEVAKSLSVAQSDVLSKLEMLDLDSGDIMIDLHDIKIA